MNSVRVEREGLFLAQDRCGGVNGREPHLGALQSGLVARPEGDAGAVLPPVERGVQERPCCGGDLGCAVARRPSESQRMRHVEHVAGIQPLRREEPLVGGVREDRVDDALGMRHRDAELRERAAGCTVEAVDRE